MTDWLEAVETPEPIEEDNLNEREASILHADSSALNKCKQLETKPGDMLEKDAFSKWKSV